jgi:phosphomannomutase
MQSIFKKYDLRGIVGEQFSISDSYDITRSIISYFKIKYPKLENIAIGMDGRSSSPEIKNQVCQAIIDSGFNAHFIGLCTTPALYFACNTLDVDAGIMITASHNPKEYNGFKLILQKESIWGDDITKIYEIYLSKNFVSSKLIGKYFTHNLIENYIDNLVQSFKHLVGDKISFAIDCGNGAGGVVIPKLIEKLNWKNVSVLYPEVDGDYPNHTPDPTEIENMLDLQALLIKNNKLEFGIGLDGDCDRMAAMTKNGNLIAGDLMLGIFALNLDQATNRVIVMDSKCSSIISQTLNKQDITCHISPTGHAFIKSYVKKYQANLGGELSGHYCFTDRHFGFDDGIYAMLRLCEIVIQNNYDLVSLVNQFPKAYCSPEIRIACTNVQKDLIINSIQTICSKWPKTIISNLDGVRVQTPSGWFLVRAANTEPVISMRIEGQSVNDLKTLKLDLLEIISNQIDKKLLITKFDL